MEQDAKSGSAVAHNELQRVMPKREASTSLILNGIGNGMMVGTIPFVGLELYSHIAEKKIPKSVYVGNAFAMVTGCALGGWFGFHEAKNLQQYRESLVSELTDVKNKANENRRTLQNWADKVISGEETSTEKTR